MEQSITISGPADRVRLADRLAGYGLMAAQYLTLLLPLLIFLGKAPVDVACSLVATLFVVAHLLKKDFSWLQPLWVRLVLLFWAYLLLRACFSAAPLLALDRAAPWGRYPFFAIAIGHWVITDRAFSRRLLVSMGIGCLALCADALWQFVSGTDILGHKKVTADRLTGPYRQPRIGYTIAWIAFPVMLACMHLDRQRLLSSLLKFVTVAVICLAVIASGERTPTLLLLMGLALAGALLPSIRCKLFWAVPAVVIFITTFLYLNPIVYERQVLSTRKVITHFWETPYGEIALDARDIIAKAPLFGIGVQHYRLATAHGTEARAQGHSHPHNFYLEIWTETGLIGLALLTAVFGCWVWNFIRLFPLWHGDYLATGLVVGIAIRLWPAIANPSFYSSWNVIPLWLMVGWFFALMRLKQAEGQRLVIDSN